MAILVYFDKMKFAVFFDFFFNFFFSEKSDGQESRKFTERCGNGARFCVFKWIIFCDFLPPPKFSYSPLRKSRTAVVLLKFF